jgi:hypothetical protein
MGYQDEISLDQAILDEGAERRRYDRFVIDISQYQHQLTASEREGTEPSLDFLNNFVQI